jgi:hypothetical protein
MRHHRADQPWTAPARDLPDDLGDGTVGGDPATRDLLDAAEDELDVLLVVEARGTHRPSWPRNGAAAPATTAPTMPAASPASQKSVGVPWPE